MSRTVELIKEYKELMDQGVITEDEFEAKKTVLLAQNDFEEEKRAAADTHSYGPQNSGMYGQMYTASPAQAGEYDSGSIGWGVLGAFIPLVGFILFLVWNSSKPKSAKSAGIGALIGIILDILIFIV